LTNFSIFKFGFDSFVNIFAKAKRFVQSASKAFKEIDRLFL